MTAKFFVDTNILLYAASKAADDQSKKQAARALLAGQEYDSVTVVNPFTIATP